MKRVIQELILSDTTGAKQRSPTARLNRITEEELPHKVIEGLGHERITKKNFLINTKITELQGLFQTIKVPSKILGILLESRNSFGNRTFPGRKSGLRIIPSIGIGVDQRDWRPNTKTVGYSHRWTLP